MATLGTDRLLLFTLLPQLVPEEDPRPGNVRKEEKKHALVPSSSGFFFFLKETHTHTHTTPRNSHSRLERSQTKTALCRKKEKKEEEEKKHHIVLPSHT